MQRWWQVCGVVVLLGAGCDSTPPVSTDPPVPVAVPEQPAAESSQAAAAPSSVATEATISGFKFQVPAGWRQAELSPAQQGFVDARFEIPRHGDDVKLTLSTISGGVDANIERWIGQFQLPEGTLPDSETLEVDGIPVTLIELSGEFQGMGQEPQSGWGMLGAAYAGAPRDFYIKLTGPSAAIAELREEFRTFVTSAKRQ
ncbi:MAG: hypothetical protein JNG89_14550 [Planctomycetaceae bacterium]|nr:hypothetical protein [Planctomycetaceae bacterium]